MNRLATNPTNEKLPVFERVIEFLNGVGYLGIAALLFLENLFPPMPSDYFDIEVEKGTFRADAKATMESTTAAAVGSAAAFREPAGSAAWSEQVVRRTSRLLGPAGASDTVPKNQASLASMRQRAVCRQPGPRRPGNPCRGGARANVLNTGIAASARRAR